MAKAAGLRVIGTAGSDEGAALISKWCSVVLKHGGTSGEIAKRVLEETHGVGVNYVLENLANVNLNIDLSVLAHGGAVAVVGSRGDVNITPRLLMGKESSICGVMLGASSDADWQEAAEYIAMGVSNGSLRPIVGRVFNGLESAPAAHEEVIAHTGGSHGKIVIQVEVLPPGAEQQ